MELDVNQGVADSTNHLAAPPSLAGLYTESSGRKMSGNKLQEGQTIDEWAVVNRIFFFQLADF